MPRLLFFVLAFLGCLSSARAGEPIRFARTPDISPDGRSVVFSYLGDLWLVDAKGGQARHLTMHESHDFNPVFSPDGKQIAFSSNRHGDYDIYVIPVEGGRPTRLTFDAADDHVTSWSPDGKQILFMSSRSTDFPRQIELYTIPATGGLVRRISAHEGRDGAFSPRGERIAYVRGPGSWFRKGYHGSSNDDVWMCAADGTDNRQLTNHNGMDDYPQWSPDSRWLYFVSDAHGGPANVVRLELDPATGAPLPGREAQPVTHQRDERVRRARLSRDGAWLVYECGPDLWLHSLKEGKSRLLHIEVHADDKVNPEKLETFTSKATEFALSQDEKHLTFVVHGEIFLMANKSGAKARRLTDHPAFDHGVAWAPDSKKLLFLSDRSGSEDIYLLEPDDPEHPELVQAQRFKVKQLTHTSEPEQGLAFSPDGKRVGFLRGGKVMTMKPDGSDEKVLAAEGQIFDYEWSPDGRWLAYARSDNHFASEIFIIPASGATLADPPRNVTRFATYNGGVTWSRTGNVLAFISQRRRDNNGAYVLPLQRPGATGKAFDWDEIHLRARQPVNMTVSQCAISNDGTKIAFRASSDGDDLWVANVDGGQVSRLTTGGTRPTQIQWSRWSSSLIYFRDGEGHIRSATVGATSGRINFQARLVVRQEDVFAEMFDQGWRALHETFYDPAFHGADWQKVRARYRPLVQHCALKEDLQALISLMLGELNASHLGITISGNGAEQQTAELGLLFEPSYRGPGLKIAEVIKHGPADRHGLNLKAGEIVFSIDRTDINETVNVSRLLNGKVGDAVVLQVGTPEAKRRVEVQGENRTSLGKLMYERWLRHNAARVGELSAGRLAYIHIPSMDEAGLDRFLRALFSDAFDKEGIVLDVRYNGGGFTHEQVLNYLGGKEHTYFRQRNGAQGLVLNSRDRRWTKPVVVLINNRSFSDAEIFPHAFRALGLGKLVGQATGGHVIGTRNIQLIDGSSFRTPRIGVRTAKGVNMEKEGVVPDVSVETHPDQLARGDDPQLARAVAVLRDDVSAWKKTRAAVTAGATGSTPLPGPSVAPSSPREE
jgi:tricorn protease